MYYKRFKEARKEKGYTQKRIAEEMKIKQQQYQKYEDGTNEMTISVLKRFCIICGVSADWILEIE